MLAGFLESMTGREFQLASKMWTSLAALVENTQGGDSKSHNSTKIIPNDL